MKSGKKYSHKIKNENPDMVYKKGREPQDVGVQNRDTKKGKEKCKKVLTKGEVCGRIKKLSERAGL